MAIPAGWAENKDSGKPGIYSATITNYKISERDLINRKIIVEVNGFTGDFNVYSETPIIGSTSFGRTPIYTRSSSGAIDIQNQTIYNNLNQQGKIQQIETTIKPKIIEINKTVATTEEKQALANSAFYKSSSNAAPAGKPKEPPQPPPGTPSETETDENGNQIPSQKEKAGLEGFGKNPEVPGEGPIRGNEGNLFGTFRYPITIDKNGQDYLKFDIIKYGTRPLNEGGIGLKKRSNGSSPVGTICLPIQPSISDNNRVNWNEDPIDMFDLGFQTIGMGLMTQEKLDTAVQNIATTVKSKILDPTLKDGLAAIITTQATQKATQSQNNLLSRMSGAILNPNMELLFQGPTLRPFQFTFRMTPRDDKEAFQIRSIIRAFKEASAVQQGIENLFLKAPYIFRIKYILGTTKKDHPSINRIKECALQQVSVDYTADQTFMTYNDENATMTSYAMSLTFTELEPVYANDYIKEKIPTDHIGY